METVLFLVVMAIWCKLYLRRLDRASRQQPRAIWPAYRGRPQGDPDLLGAVIAETVRRGVACSAR